MSFGARRVVFLFDSVYLFLSLHLFYIFVVLPSMLECLVHCFLVLHQLSNHLSLILVIGHHAPISRSHAYLLSAIVTQSVEDIQILLVIFLNLADMGVWHVFALVLKSFIPFN